jgi:hypothetical protein
VWRDSRACWLERMLVCVSILLVEDSRDEMAWRRSLSVRTSLCADPAAEVVIPASWMCFHLDIVSNARKTGSSCLHEEFLVSKEFGGVEVIQPFGKIRIHS